MFGVDSGMVAIAWMKAQAIAWMKAQAFVAAFTGVLTRLRSH